MITSLLSRLLWVGVFGLVIGFPFGAEANQSFKGVGKKIQPSTGSCYIPGSSPPQPKPECIARGKELFEKETFNGNGRTCATCHPASNNFTIDVDYISKLPKSDPLFVGETNPDLHGLEMPPPDKCPQGAPKPCTVLRTDALICENLDGLDKPCVLRSVPHTEALSVTTTPDPDITAYDEYKKLFTVPPTATSPSLPAIPARPSFHLAGALGWSGDGAPASGSLRDFATGAVIQHFPKTLARIEGQDFRLPSEDELDALLEFQKTIGRKTDYSLSPAPLFEPAPVPPNPEVPSSKDNALFNCYDGTNFEIADLEYLATHDWTPEPGKCRGYAGSTKPVRLPPDVIRFSDRNADLGQLLFFGGMPTENRAASGNAPLNTRSCSGCHVQASVGTPKSPHTPPLTGNRNRATGAEMSPKAPPCLANGTNIFNGDGGFGAGNGGKEDINHNTTMVCPGVSCFPTYNRLFFDDGVVDLSKTRSDICQTGGAGSSDQLAFTGRTFFNVPPVIEAASTPPFFHNNIAQTVEEAILFYNSDEFTSSISGGGRRFLFGANNTRGGSPDDPTCARAGSTDCQMVQAVGAFLRAANAYNSLLLAKEALEAAKNAKGQEKVDQLKLALKKIKDANGVLSSCNAQNSANLQGNRPANNLLCGPLDLFSSRPIVKGSFNNALARLQNGGANDTALGNLSTLDLSGAHSALEIAGMNMLAD